MPEPGAAIAVIAPGTGLGEGFLTWDGRGSHARASEGGHVEFGPANALQIELLRHLGEKFEHVSYERVCCGPGIFNIYDFLRQKSLAEVPEWLSKELAGVPDPTPVIVDAAMDPVKRCRICEMALDIFASILGAEAGNLALKVMATNGVYLAGGIPPRILKILENGKFMQSFRNKGRESFILSQIPVKVIMNTRAGLIGAASSAWRILHRPLQLRSRAGWTETTVFPILPDLSDRFCCRTAAPVKLGGQRVTATCGNPKKLVNRPVRDGCSQPVAGRST